MDVTREQLAGAIETVRLRVPIENLASDALAKRLLNALPDVPAGPEPEVSRAHLCDDQCPADPELHAMAVLLPALPMVSKLGVDARERVMDWARRRACDGLPPF